MSIQEKDHNVLIIITTQLANLQKIITELRLGGLPMHLIASLSRFYGKKAIDGVQCWIGGVEMHLETNICLRTVSNMWTCQSGFFISSVTDPLFYYMHLFQTPSDAKTALWEMIMGSHKIGFDSQVRAVNQQKNLFNEPSYPLVQSTIRLRWFK